MKNGRVFSTFNQYSNLVRILPAAFMDLGNASNLETNLATKKYSWRRPHVCLHLIAWRRILKQNHVPTSRTPPHSTCSIIIPNIRSYVYVALNSIVMSQLNGCKLTAYHNNTDLFVYCIGPCTIRRVHSTHHLRTRTPEHSQITTCSHAISP